MKKGLVALALLVGLGVAFVLAVFLASHYGGERVTLRTEDAAGEWHATPLWVVELEGTLFLRAGDRASGWVERLRAEPVVELRRGGPRRRYRAELAPERTGDVSARMAAKYGLADRLVGLIRDPDRSVAVRLQPVGE